MSYTDTKTYPDIRDRILSLDSHTRRRLSNFIELILCVSTNYSHIQDLDMLKVLFGDSNSDYDKQYDPGYIDAAQIAKDIVKVEYSYRYNKDINTEYLLVSVCVNYFPDICKYNRHWKEVASESYTTKKLLPA